MITKNKAADRNDANKDAEQAIKPVVQSAIKSNGLGVRSGIKVGEPQPVPWRGGAGRGSP